MKKTTIALICLLSISIYAQNESKKSILELGGFISWTGMYDSRQTIGAREGQLLFFPSDILLDRDGNDINAKDNLNMLAVHTRLNMKINGAEVLGAQSTGFIEGEFFGTSDGDVNGFRLRHAYVNLNWGSTSLMLGQYWNPMVVTEAFPQVVSPNAGIPFQPFSRNPQVRLSHNIGSIKLIAAVLTQRDFTSGGPNGFNSSYLRNAALPTMHFQMQTKLDDVFFGAGIEYKKINPRLTTSQNVITEEAISSISTLAFLKLSLPYMTVIAEGFYGGNASDLMMLGGYAVTDVEPTTGIEKYANVNSYSFWVDVTTGQEIKPGIFFGYSKSLGSQKNIVGNFYSRAATIGNQLRISPRIETTINKFNFGLEIEYTRALYGIPDINVKVEKGEHVSNTRILMALSYYL